MKIKLNWNKNFSKKLINNCERITIGGAFYKRIFLSKKLEKSKDGRILKHIKSRWNVIGTGSISRKNTFLNFHKLQL